MSSPESPSHLLSIAVHTPAHSAVGELLCYACAAPLPAGSRVKVVGADSHILLVEPLG